MSNDLESHYNRFKYNQAAAPQFEEQLPNYRDWSCVIMFYAALHLLDAYLTTKNLPDDVDHHAVRNRAMLRHPELRRSRAHEAYRQLQDTSEQVRYDAGFVYRANDHAAAKRNLAKVISVVEPLVKRHLSN